MGLRRLHPLGKYSLTRSSPAAGPSFTRHRGWEMGFEAPLHDPAVPSGPLCVVLVHTVKEGGARWSRCTGSRGRGPPERQRPTESQDAGPGPASVRLWRPGELCKLSLAALQGEQMSPAPEPGHPPFPSPARTRKGEAKAPLQRACSVRKRKQCSWSQGGPRSWGPSPLASSFGVFHQTAAQLGHVSVDCFLSGTCGSVCRVPDASLSHQR